MTKHLSQGVLFLQSRRIFICLMMVGGTSQGSAWAENDRLPPPATKKVDFVKDVQPIFRKLCYSCHGPEVQEGELRLDIRKRALAGGENGKVIVAGNSVGSVLIQLTAGIDADGRIMPPTDEGGPLTKGQVALLRAWIDQGAKWPQSADAIARTDHWSFQPLKRPPLPTVINSDWSRNPVDMFILARLEKNGLTPAPPANKRRWARRAFFDLTGLPPTPAAVDAFVADESAVAYDKLIDRLLTSPHYGERWGRHWLDLVRYADTNGYEVDGLKPLVWKYRDYIIDALNEDKPYNQFVLEQLAGDELPNADTATVIATGYYRLGAWDAERGASVQKSEMIAERYNELDDMISTTSQVFLGLTMGCARCHNHKFDPLTTQEYYSMASIFNPLTRPRKGRAELAAPAVSPAVLKANPKGQFTQGYFLRETSPKPPVMHLLIRGNPNRPGPVIGPSVPAALVEQQPPFLPADEFTSRRRLSLARWIVDRQNPLTSRVIVNRVWQYHFGEGLVRTPSDFGRQGERPTHPRLLDWLADWFVHEGGWSLKRLHRLIMTSSTYHLSKRWDPAAAATDPEDRLLYRFPPRRLELEAIRDSMLAVSGQLNRKMYGPSMYPHLSEAAKRSGYDPSKVWKPFDEKAASRRTLYAFLKRSLIVPMFDVLDFCDTARSADRRNVTTVTPQALTLFNGEFVNRQARHFANRLLKESGSQTDWQIERAYHLALGRPPTSEEQADMRKFLQFEADSLLRDSSTEKLQTVLSPPQKSLALWLNAGANVAKNEQNVVSAWADQSGRRQNAKAKNDPVWVANVLNGHPVVRFDGSDDWFALTGQVIASQQHTIFAVINDNGGEGTRNLFGNWDGSKGNSHTSVFLGTATGASGQRKIRFTDAFANDPFKIQLSTAREHFLLTAVADSDNARIFQNLTQIGNKGATIGPRNLSTNWVVGRQGTLNGEYWNGDLAELLVYETALNAADRDRVWRYLGRKYAITQLNRPLKPLDRDQAHRLALIQMCRVIFNLNEFVYTD